MTVTQLYRAPSSADGFTVEDLFDFDPGEGYRTELLEGRFVVSPPPATPHHRSAYKLRRLLEAVAPGSILVLTEGLGVYATEHDYLIPDMVVVTQESLRTDRPGVRPSEVLLAVEVVSPSSSGYDNLTKRHAYAKFGIRHYWIVDPRNETLRILELGDDGSYVDKELLKPGQSWTATAPFEVTFDPAEIFRS